MTSSSNQEKTKRSGHERGEPNEAYFEELHLSSTRIQTLRGKSSRQHQMYQGNTSQVTIYLEGAQYDSRLEESTRRTCQDEQTVRDKVENMMSHRAARAEEFWISKGLRI